MFTRSESHERLCSALDEASSAADRKSMKAPVKVKHYEGSSEHYEGSSEHMRDEPKPKTRKIDSPALQPPVNKARLPMVPIPPNFPPPPPAPPRVVKFGGVEEFRYDGNSNVRPSQSQLDQAPFTWPSQKELHEFVEDYYRRHPFGDISEVADDDSSDGWVDGSA